MIGKRRKTFTVKAEGWQGGKRQNVYAAIGMVGDIAAREARLKARECLTRIAKGLPAFEPPEIHTPPTPMAENPPECGV